MAKKKQTFTNKVGDSPGDSQIRRENLRIESEHFRLRQMRDAAQDMEQYELQRMKIKSPLAMENANLDQQTASEKTENEPAEKCDTSSTVPIATRGSRVLATFSWLFPKWFMDEFGLSLLHDLLDVVKEQGSGLWWLPFSTQLLGITLKFVWRRVDRRKRRSHSGGSKNKGD